MREIKFRAWDKTVFDETEKGRMLYRNQQYGLSPQKQICDDCWTRFWESLARLKEYEYILMQFTGLKDKNGKEIYEGDIILSKGIPDVYFEIGFGDDYDKEVFGFTLKSIRSKMKLSYPLCRDVEKYEVIGNIYENPELLK